MSHTAFFRAFAALILICAAGVVQAEAIYFSLSRTDRALAVTNLGNASAFYPAVLRLAADGQWETLLPVNGAAQAELVAGAALEFVWPAQSGGVDSFMAMRSVMVRFFDQAGAGFGQISFFNVPPPVRQPLKAAYEGRELVIQPPATPRVTWLLWPQEEGIAPLHKPVRFEHRQPMARRLVWKGGEAPRRFDLGAGRPAPLLLHETPQGMELQYLDSGRRQGPEQRAAWLRAAPVWNAVAVVALAAAALLFFWHAGRRFLRRRPQ